MRKRFASLLLILILAISMLAYYNFVYLPERERELLERRIKPLTDAGLTEEEALAFDEAYDSWAPYNQSAVDYALFLKRYPQTATFLLELTSLEKAVNSLKGADHVIAQVGDEKAYAYLWYVILNVSDPKLVIHQARRFTRSIIERRALTNMSKIMIKRSPLHTPLIRAFPVVGWIYSLTKFCPEEISQVKEMASRLNQDLRSGIEDYYMMFSPKKRGIKV